MSKPYQPLYTPEQRKRRDLSAWTWIQGVLAPIQFLVFLVSITLVIRYLVTGEDYQLATVSILIKTFFLLLIMLTGCIWEKVVFGKYLFAEAFFWEDVVSMGVIFTSGICLRLIARRAESTVVDGFSLSCICNLFYQCYPVFIEITGCPKGSRQAGGEFSGASYQ